MLELVSCVLTVAFVALVTDLASRRIPNGLTLPALLFGLAAQTALHGVPGLAMAVLGVLVGFLVLVGPFALGFMGAGDVKLVAALGAYLGPLGVLIVVLVATLASGAIAFAVAARGGLLGRAVRGSLDIVHPGRRRTPAGASVGRLPYALPVAIGTVLAIPILVALPV